MPNLATIFAYLQSRLARQDEGATAVEYGLMVSLVALVMIVGVKAFGQHLSDFFTTMVTKF